MSTQEMRLECLKLAQAMHPVVHRAEDVVATAAMLMSFVDGQDKVHRALSDMKESLSATRSGLRVEP